MATPPFPSLLLSVALVSATATADAQNGPDAAVGNDEIIMSAWSDPTRCNRRNAVPTSFGQAIRKSSSLQGLCVQIVGFWQGRALFARESDAGEDSSSIAPGLRHRRIGLYGRDELLGAAPEQAKRFLMVGIMADCDRFGSGAIMVMGYCHYTGGPILLLSEAFAASRRNAR